MESLAAVACMDWLHFRGKNYLASNAFMTVMSSMCI
jgi:hypothetical protein